MLHFYISTVTRVSLPSKRSLPFEEYHVRTLFKIRDIPIILKTVCRSAPEYIAKHLVPAKQKCRTSLDWQIATVRNQPWQIHAIKIVNGVRGKLARHGDDSLVASLFVTGQHRRKNVRWKRVSKKDARRDDTLSGLRSLLIAKRPAPLTFVPPFCSSRKLMIAPVFRMLLISSSCHELK